MSIACRSFRQKLDLKKLAEEQASSLEYWFRQKYNLPPKDPRFLEMEDWEVALEWETELALKRKLESYRKRCPKCKIEVIGDVCPGCGRNIGKEQVVYSDPDFDEYEKEVLEENERFFKELRWKEVTMEEELKEEEEM